jgi:hypothetical protein
MTARWLRTAEPTSGGREHNVQRHLLLLFVVACSIVSFAAAQTNSTPFSTTQPKPSASSTKQLDLTGCVQGVEGGLDQYVLVDGKDKKTYRLSGKGLRTYVGRHVRVEGGLYPSANVAAQAGAIDPAQAAAAAPVGDAGPRTLVELRVQRVRRLAGSCPQP